MDKLLDILQLCLPRLTPNDMCMLRCTCSELRDMKVSWRDHSILFQLDGSISALAWLQKNIVCMQTLRLDINFSLPGELLHDAMKGGR